MDRTIIIALYFKDQKLTEIQPKTNYKRISQDGKSSKLYPNEFFKLQTVEYSLSTI